MFIKSLIGPFALLCTFLFGCSVAMLLRPSHEVNLPEIVSLPIASIDESTPAEDIHDQSFNGWYQLETQEGMDEVMLISLDHQIDNETGKIDEENSGASVFTSFEKYGEAGVIGHSWSKFALPDVEFRTKKINGFDYTFTGVFFRNKTVGENGEKLLRGTLQKFNKGKKVAELKGDFAYYEPHCWH